MNFFYKKNPTFIQRLRDVWILMKSDINEGRTHFYKHELDNKFKFGNCMLMVELLGDEFHLMWFTYDNITSRFEWKVAKKVVIYYSWRLQELVQAMNMKQLMKKWMIKFDVS
jgi:hypothetical protein